MLPLLRPHLSDTAPRVPPLPPVSLTRVFFCFFLVSRSLHATRYGLQFNIHSLCDSRGWIASGIGRTPLTSDELTASITFKANETTKNDARRSFAQYPDLGHIGDALTMVDTVLPAIGGPALVIDASGAEGTGPALLSALSHGAGVTMANKKPLAGSQSLFDSLTSSIVRQRIRFESTIGAGTPFVAATERIIASGDQVRRACGTFSGTLGYVMSGLESGKSYSTVVREAAALGYTEPDPRDDLGGVDVARKAIILARILGWQVDLSQVDIQPLYPHEFINLTIPEFLSQLETQDDVYAARCQAARQKGEVLRYVANLEDGKITVGLKVGRNTHMHARRVVAAFVCMIEACVCLLPLALTSVAAFVIPLFFCFFQSVPADTPLGRLQGSDNLLTLYTDIYSSSPLVIQGAGAGGAITAAGILADMVELTGTIDRREERKQ